jgi:hypothetical protein
VNPFRPHPLLILPLLAAAMTAAQAAPPAAPPSNNPTEQGWYLRLTVATPDGKLKDAGNVLGQLPDSLNGLDRHDLAELPPAFSPYLTLVFPHPEWGAESSYYASDFHAIDFARPDSWTFEVRSSNPNQQVTLSWSAPTPAEADPEKNGNGRDHIADMIGRMWLEDLDTGETVNALDPQGELQEYAFTMNGQRTRNFRWALQGGNGRNPALVRSPRARLWAEPPAEDADGQPAAPDFQR